MSGFIVKIPFLKGDMSGFLKKVPLPKGVKERSEPNQ